ncbi:hypothetical protein [Pyrobaculum aerophilum]|uniref:Uncharacterized protein n=1 Tax=Pyrobaculum aerophilum TaxID=13773 RepID=A0A371QZP3_9CREN|nr:hypothetical protein [Pyrobaculum aerophilum]RFA96183.1 hypothetical protein CGL51_05835 [Pyrobaculum aerophilum]RFA98590.1 hypothetical protein CGL52_06625 [Pyrobaculum aerophilum]
MAERIISMVCQDVKTNYVYGVRGFIETCEKIRWRGPGCAAIEVLFAIWRFREKGEVPLSADKLGLGPRHIPFIMRLQEKFGPVALWENAVIYMLQLAEEAISKHICRIFGCR